MRGDGERRYSDPIPMPIPSIARLGDLLVPLQGDVSDHQLEGVCDSVLARIARDGAEGLSLDASGLSILDSHLCAGLGRLATAARLMGGQSVLCGLSAEVVLTLQSMGFELQEVQTATPLPHALERLGVSVHRNSRSEGARE